MAVKVETLAHVMVVVTDVDRARAFYGSLLGLEEVERPDTYDFPGVWFRAGTALIHLVSRERPAPRSDQHLCLWVQGIQEANATLEAAGFATEWARRKLPGVSRFYVRDPDGNRIELCGADGTKWAA
jgi:catechol 2,3-dioxygenase-like lactoylglutathione lyase family enzyme